MPNQNQPAKETNDKLQSNPKLTVAIDQLKTLLEPVQEKLNSQFQAPKYPVVLILGNSRSGTTLLTQILSRSTYFAYPSNFLSRFAYAPQLGALIQEILFNPELELNKELYDLKSTPEFLSTYGKTQGALSINEFFHFWRKFFPNDAPEHINEEQLHQVDITRMRQELAAIESVFNKPLVSKGKMMQFNIEYFAKNIPELFFIHIRREPKYVMKSIMKARSQFHRTEQAWWSGRPKEYPMLSNMPPTHQVAGQVLFTDQAIVEGLSTVNQARKISLNYEDLCSRPEEFFDELRDKLSELGVALGEYNLEQNYPSGNKNYITTEQSKALESAYAELQKTSGTLSLL